MRSLGTVTAAVLSAVGVLALVVGLRSIPDIRRYLKIRQM